MNRSLALLCSFLFLGAPLLGVQRELDAEVEERSVMRARALEGDPDAKLWLLEKDVGEPLERLSWARDLVRDHAHEDHVLLPRFPAWLAQDRTLVVEDLRTLARGLAETAASSHLAAASLVALGRAEAPLGIESRERRKRARTLYREVRERWADTPAAADAEQELWYLNHMAVGRKAPGFTAKDARGNELLSDHLKGRIVIVQLWSNQPGEWSARTREAERWRNRLWDERFTWLGVNLDPDADQFVRHCEDWDIDWKQHAWEGGEDRAVCKAWRLGQRPTLVLLDAEGIIRGIDLDPEQLEHRLTDLMADLRAKIHTREQKLEEPANTGR